MESTFQCENQSIAEHGRSVSYYYLDLIQNLKDQKPFIYEWKIPDWARSQRLLCRLLPFPTTICYLIYHDCGKPYCCIKDSDGRQHFPDHARISQKVFDQLRQTHKFSQDDNLVSRLIREDMDIHLLKDAGVEEFSRRDTSATQLLVGLAELHSNATMFGGMETIGFKSKYRNLNRRGKRINKIWKEKM